MVRVWARCSGRPALLQPCTRVEEGAWILDPPTDADWLLWFEGHRRPLTQGGPDLRRQREDEGDFGPGTQQPARSWGLGQSGAAGAFQSSCTNTAGRAPDTDGLGVHSESPGRGPGMDGASAQQGASEPDLIFRMEMVLPSEQAVRTHVKELVCPLPRQPCRAPQPGLQAARVPRPGGCVWGPSVTSWLLLRPRLVASRCPLCVSFLSSSHRTVNRDLPQ